MNRLFWIVLAALLSVCPMLAEDPMFSEALIAAATKGELAWAQQLVSGGQSVNCTDKRGWTPLMWAVYCYRLPMAEYLLSKGADPNIQSTRSYKSFPKGTTALIIAGYMGEDDQAQLLVKHHAKVELANEDGKSAADYAREFEFPAVVRALGIQEPVNALLAGLLKGIDGGKDVNAGDEYGWTPLMWSVFYEDLPTTERLLAKGADPNIQATRAYRSHAMGITALMIASAAGQEDHVAVLLKHKAQVSLVDKQGKSAVHYARERKSVPILFSLRAPVNADMEDLLAGIRAGKDVNAPGVLGLTPLMWAVFYEDKYSAGIILESGADPNVRSTAAYRTLSNYTLPKGATALTIAGQYGMAEMASMLLKRKADPGLADDTGNTAESYASRYKFFDILNVLVDRSPLKNAYPKLILEVHAAKAMMDRHSEAIEALTRSCQDQLIASRRFERIEGAGPGATLDAATLLAKVDVDEIALPSDTARNWSGTAAQSWYVTATVRLLDASTGAELRKQRLSTWNRVAVSPLSVFSTDRNYAKDTGIFLAKYVLEVSGQRPVPPGQGVLP